MAGAESAQRVSEVVGENSYRLQAICLKTNYEAAHARGLSGYGQWASAGFPGLCRRRGRYIFPTEGPECCGIRKFNAPTVLLMDCPRRNFRWGDTVRATLLVSRYEDRP